MIGAMQSRNIPTHRFSDVPQVQSERSSFDRSHSVKTTFDAGKLIPIFVDEVLPGDTFTLKSTMFGRMATPIYPVMDNIAVDTFYFFVPYRLVWSNFRKFMGEQANPTDSISFVVPQIVAPAGGYGELSLYDYFGLPTKIATYSHSALPFRAYSLIWNEWFRDQNLQTSRANTINDGPDPQSDYILLDRGKRHDYFTSCLPYPQKGATTVSIPLGTRADIRGLGKSTGVFPTASASSRETGGATVVYPNASVIDGATGDATFYARGTNATTGFPDIYADLSTATAATINQLRQSFQIQKLLERDARGGTRYTEIVRSHFGVSSPDARLQRPEFLGGGTSYVNINPVAQTSNTNATSPQGNLSAMATVASQHGFTSSFTEHGVIIGMACARADLTYQQGLNRMWSRRTRYDFYWPSLSHIGEQSVFNQEIYAQAIALAADTGIFGYQERYSEYRYKPSQVCGLFRSNAAAPLDSWHLAQNFTSLPTLGDTFIKENPPIDRVIAVPSQPHFIFDIFHDLRTARLMPLYGTPGMIDHF